jgi:hypothetical protein
MGNAVSAVGRVGAFRCLEFEEDVRIYSVLLRRILPYPVTALDELAILGRSSNPLPSNWTAKHLVCIPSKVETKTTPSDTHPWEIS